MFVADDAGSNRIFFLSFSSFIWCETNEKLKENKTNGCTYHSSGSRGRNRNGQRKKMRIFWSFIEIFWIERREQQNNNNNNNNYGWMFLLGQCNWGVIGR